MSDPKKRANTGVTIFLFLFASVLIFLAFKQQFESQEKEAELTQRISQSVTEQVVNRVEQTLSKPSEFPDFDSLSRLEKLVVVSDFESWTPGANTQDEKIRKVIILDRGDLAKAYIYVRASLDSKALTRWESIYVKLDNSGGHLFRKESLPIPKGDKTELLYTLDNIPYLQSVPYSELRVPLHVDWFQFFRNKAEVELLTFVSSLRPALIEEISLYYECIEASECLLTLKNMGFR
ncbi:MAG: hypothetical protein UY26_C0003G0198 [Candidatus Jorgensenbacteria bacterium GW2011_GWA1_48_13]|uniref:Uncharacterized protein n=2 Tax=Candidatus Joergenseniibacteriota TaxID=1752739 RepID=A0A0G1W8V6_9BACT|nr:MAG: hypothetical protein UY26_C0003G0198 [Candidatus Jorgensenbacteria bacterium GW2011_GWA1_48_13]KKU98923.1 MAG: hypothetical protein UY32_C0011G0008 [Candidatus Jorgensenbacteria bacterium GW2011_GWC1_48_8]KKW15153.1 MAG: hypothetical protein UY55_C0002G0211 [Candidatus Jorgensenbacteria bacterium GW2011_GWB1_50_10]